MLPEPGSYEWLRALGGIGQGGGAVGGLLLPAVVSSFSFFTGFAGIGVTGAVAGLMALLGPRVSGRRLEDVSA